MMGLPSPLTSLCSGVSSFTIRRASTYFEIRYLPLRKQGDMGKRDEATARATGASAINEARFEGTGYSYTLSLIRGKHKMSILYCLMEYQPVRFNEMRRYLGGVSDRTLSRSLKELEADGLVARREYPQIPPRVEYSLTERGASLMEVLDLLCVWGERNRPGD